MHPVLPRTGKFGCLTSVPADWSSLELVLAKGDNLALFFGDFFFGLGNSELLGIGSRWPLSKLNVRRGDKGTNSRMSSSLPSNRNHNHWIKWVSNSLLQDMFSSALLPYIICSTMGQSQALFSYPKHQIHGFLAHTAKPNKVSGHDVNLYFAINLFGLCTFQWHWITSRGK